MEKISFKKILESIKKYSMVIVLVFILAMFQVLTGGLAMKPLNITNLLLQNSYILVLAIGMLILIVLQHTDLSVGSVVAIVGAVAGKLIIEKGVPVPLAILLCLLLGIVIGAWQGFWVAKVNLPAFIVSLANMLLFRGLTLVILGGKSLAPFPDSFRKISTGFIPDPLPRIFGLKSLTMIITIALILFFNFMRYRNRKKKLVLDIEVDSFRSYWLKKIVVSIVIFFFGYTLASYEGIPNILIILGVLAAIYIFITTQTTLGRRIYAIGGNKKAAALSGIDTTKITFLSFVNMGFLAAVSGIIFAARLDAATPQAGTSFELDAIAACYIGGASASGGIGTIIGALIGGLVMAVLNNGMSLMGIGSDWQQAIKGLVLLLAVAFDVYSKRKEKNA